MTSEKVLHVVESEGPPADDLARESLLIERAAAGETGLLLSSWRGPVVVLGYGQPVSDVDREWCRAHRVPILRRSSGGTGVVHNGDLGVALALPGDHPWTAGIVGLYGRFLGALEPALRACGGEIERLAEPRRASRVRSPVCFLDQLADTLAVGGRKAVGCAQTRRRGVVLVHAAVLLGLDPELYAKVFGVPAEVIEAALAPAVPGGSWRAVGTAIAENLAENLGLEARHREPEPVPERLLGPYATERWAPVKF